MRRWRDGDLAGVDPRAELDLVRTAVREILADGEDPTPLLRALAELDPPSCAELLVGVRAVADPALVGPALAVAEGIGAVVPPSALCRRLLDLVPTALDEIRGWALTRHPGAAWAWRLDRGERIAGLGALSALSEVDPADASGRALALGFGAAVEARAAAGDVASLRALAVAGELDRTAAAVAALLDAGSADPVVPWVAAWWGADLDPLLDAVAARLGTPAARRRLVGLATGLPDILAALQDVADEPR